MVGRVFGWVFFMPFINGVRMICPICKKPPVNDHLYGWYRGNLFVVKAFKCCQETWPVGVEGHITKFVFDAKKEDYFQSQERYCAPLVKFDYMRLLVGNANVCRGGSF